MGNFILSFLLVLFAGIAWLSTPVSIIYGIYWWAVEDLEFKAASWGAAKLWMLMISAIIPAFFLLWRNNKV